MLGLKHKSFLPHIVQPSCLSLILSCIFCFLSSVRLLYLVLYWLCPLFCQYSCFVVYPSLIWAFCVFAVHTGNPSLPSSSKGAETPPPPPHPHPPKKTDLQIKWGATKRRRNRRERWERKQVWFFDNRKKKKCPRTLCRRCRFWQRL